MNRSFKIGLFVLFLTTVALDYFTKSALVTFLNWGSFGPLHFEPHQNSGFILSSLSNTSQSSRVVFVGSLYGFLVFAYFLLNFLISAALPTLRIGLTLFFASITANTIDKIAVGSVNDFICITLGSRKYFFNFADVFMWIGTAFILSAIFKSEELIWHPDSKRKKYLVNTLFQYRWALQTGLVTFSCTVILILFSYSFIFHAEHPLSPADKPIYLFGALTLGLLFSAITFLASVLFSHRSAGPLYAFEKYVEALFAGENPKFSLRKNDEHQNLVVLADKLSANVAQNRQNRPQHIGKRQPLNLKILNGTFAICRLPPNSKFPAWVDLQNFYSTTVTEDELSIVCAQESVPKNIKSERDWAVIQVEGPLDFGLTGILSSITTPLANAKISVFAVSTFDTDYVLVKKPLLKDAQKVLKDTGFKID